MPYAELLAVWRDGEPDEALPRNTGQPIDLPAGTVATIYVTLIDYRGKRIDLDLAGTDRLEMVVSLVTSTGALFTRLATKLTDAVGHYAFAIAAVDTQDYSGKVIYTVRCTRGPEKQQVITPSYLSLGLGVQQ